MVVEQCQETIAAFESDGRSKRQFEFMGACVACYSDEVDLIDWLHHNFAQTGVDASTRPPNIRVYASKSERLFVDLYGVGWHDSAEKTITTPLTPNVDLIYRKSRNRYAKGAGFYVLFKASRQILVVSPHDALSRRMHVMLIIRRAFQMLLVERGWVLFHAACVAKAGMGIGIAGGKHAGKTSTLINLLSRLGCDLIANDKILLKARDGDLLASAPPQKVNIRVGTVAHDQHLQRWLREEGQTTYPNMQREQIAKIEQMTSAETLSERAEKIVLSPQELCDLYHVSIVPWSKLKLLLIPEYVPTLTRSRLVRQTHGAVPALAPHFLAMSCRQTYLDRLFGFDGSVIERRCQSLLQEPFRRLPIYRLYQSAATNAHSAELVQELIETL